MKLKNSRFLMTGFFVLLVAFVQTYVMFVLIYPEFYINGDNKFYENAYVCISHLGILEAYSVFVTTGGSGSEPISFLIMFLSSKLYSYEVYFYLSNVLFLIIFGVLLSKFFKKWVFAYIVLSFSFYIFIVSGLTQRLSIAVMLWMLYEMVDSVYWKRIFAFASLAAHWQMLLVFGVKYIAFSMKNIVHFNVKKQLLLFIPLGLIVFFALYGQFSHKIGYMSSGTIHIDAILILVWPAILFVIGYKLTHEQIIFFIIIFLGALIISSGRLNIMCFFFCLFLLRGHDKKLMYFSLVIFPYFVYQHIGYYFTSYQPASLLS